MILRFAASISGAHDADQAVEELLAPIDARITPGMVDLAFLFTTAHFEDETESVVGQVQSALPNAIIMGCTAEGTIGVDREIERAPSMSLVVATLPDVRVRPFHVVQDQIVGVRGLADLERMVGVSPESKPVFVAFGDPFSADISAFVGHINDYFPGSLLIGGVASAARAPRENRLFSAAEIHREGIVGVGLSGRLKVDAVVSQGCRPIGKPFVITKGERNVVYELGGRAALKRLQEVLVNLSQEDEALARQALLIGRVIDERKDSFVRGDFLIHNIIGVDKSSGAIGVNGHAKVGATVQFHVRDAASADEDLRALLAPYAHQDVRGAMLFGCNGRGTNMWSKPGHDIGVLREVLGEVPTAGFFCGGEFGPVGGANFVHGFTASVGLFRPSDE
ncbi:MAG: FIST C-terminal domain-containing protein [Planctomycetes bacterium]|nr:FIST C-terminal domain-containing protein [Planctomycetota bacterium]